MDAMNPLPTTSKLHMDDNEEQKCTCGDPMFNEWADAMAAANKQVVDPCDCEEDDDELRCNDCGQVRTINGKWAEMLSSVNEALRQAALAMQSVQSHVQGLNDENEALKKGAQAGAIEREQLIKSLEVADQKNRVLEEAAKEKEKEAVAWRQTVPQYVEKLRTVEKTLEDSNALMETFQDEMQKLAAQKERVEEEMNATNQSFQKQVADRKATDAAFEAKRADDEKEKSELREQLKDAQVIIASEMVALADAQTQLERKRTELAEEQGSAAKERRGLKHQCYLKLEECRVHYAGYIQRMQERHAAEIEKLKAARIVDAREKVSLREKTQLLEKAVDVEAGGKIRLAIHVQSLNREMAGVKLDRDTVKLEREAMAKRLETAEQEVAALKAAKEAREAGWDIVTEAGSDGDARSGSEHDGDAQDAE